MQYNYVANYVPRRGQTIFTHELKDGDSAVVTFTTPADLHEGGKGGSVGFVNQGEVTVEGNNSNRLTMEFEGHVTNGPLSGTIGFNHAPLKPSTTYTVKVTTAGPAPDGIRIKLTAR